MFFIVILISILLNFNNAHSAVYNMKVLTIPYEHEIARGRVRNAMDFHMFGQRLAIGNTLTDIWEGTAVTLPTPSDSGEQMTLVSTSALDDIDAGGTGVKTVEIHYLDANGIEQEEHVNLQGLTTVNTVATNIRFVNIFHATAVGTNMTAVGDISIYRTGDATRVYSVIKATGNAALSSARMVPLNKTLYLTDFSATSTEAKSVSIKLRITAHEGELYPDVFLFHDTCFIVDSGCQHFYIVPVKVPSLSKIKVSATGTAAGANASVHLSGWME